MVVSNMVYTSIDNDKIREIAKLKDKKYRKDTGFFLIEGEHLIREAYKAGYLEKIIKLEGTDIDINVDTLEVSMKVLKFISNLETPTIIGVCRKKTDEIKGDHILILDNIQDPGNLGTIIRSAVAFNVDTIILSNDTVDLYNEKVIRATQGLIFNINILRADLVKIIENLKEKNYKIYATKVNGGKNIKNLEKSQKFAIIMGNEGNGVRNNLIEMSDECIHITMNEKCESLNVGVATSIILYELDK